MPLGTPRKLLDIHELKELLAMQPTAFSKQLEMKDERSRQETLRSTKASLRAHAKGTARASRSGSRGAPADADVC